MDGNILVETPTASVVSPEFITEAVTNIVNAVTTIADTVPALSKLQKIRRYCIKFQSICDRSIEAFIVSFCLGYSTELEAANRKKCFEVAAKIRIAIEKTLAGKKKKGGEPYTWDEWKSHLGAEEATIVSLVGRTAKSRAVWDEKRDEVEAEMTTLVQMLPIWRSIQAQKDRYRGFGPKGLAVLLGEAGDPSNFSTVAKLWKRLGLAVMDGRRQGNPVKNTSEEWIKHAYCDRRRSEVFVFVETCVIRTQLTGVAKGKPPGHYAKIYQERKAYEQALNESGGYAELATRKLAEKNSAKSVEAFLKEGMLSPGHINNRARRYMAKKFVKDLWVAWRAAMREEPALSILV